MSSDKPNRMYDKRGGFSYVDEKEAARVPIEQEKTARVVMPEEDFRALQAIHNQPHGICRHFRYRDGQDQAQSEQFFQRLFKEEKWKRRWVGDPQDFGICDIFPERLLNRHNPGVCRVKEAMNHPRFDQASVEWKQLDEMILCPWFESRLARGEKISTTRMGIGRK